MSKSEAKVSVDKLKGHVSGLLSDWTRRQFSTWAQVRQTRLITRASESNQQLPCRQEQEGSRRLLQHSRVSRYCRKRPQRHEPAFPVRAHTLTFHNSVPLCEPPTQTGPGPRPNVRGGQPASRSTFSGQSGPITPPREEQCSCHPQLFFWRLRVTIWASRVTESDPSQPKVCSSVQGNVVFQLCLFSTLTFLVQCSCVTAAAVPHGWFMEPVTPSSRKLTPLKQTAEHLTWMLSGHCSHSVLTLMTSRGNYRRDGSKSKTPECCLCMEMDLEVRRFLWRY